MIRATSTDSRVVDINKVQYKYQTLHFHSEVMGVLQDENKRKIHSTSGIDVAAKKRLMYSKQKINTAFSQSIDSPLSKLQNVHSPLSTPRSRKSSVVQIKRQSFDEYSDDDMLSVSLSSDDDDAFVATVCYVDGCSIKNKSRLKFSGKSESICEGDEEF
uniref:Uncharacterized protein n=1 Tax=Clytia hemisphaerica TaxID=252671 RepID=A0A7M6DP96_9CNID|eukprot:TCONS_00048822-protein